MDSAIYLSDVDDDSQAVISWDGEGLIISTGPKNAPTPNEHIVATDVASIVKLRDFLNWIAKEMGGK